MPTHSKCQKFEQEIERLKEENEELKEALNSIACFDRPEPETQDYWLTRPINSIIDTLINDTQISRDILRKLRR